MLLPRCWRADAGARWQMVLAIAFGMVIQVQVASNTMLIVATVVLAVFTT